MSLYRIIPLVLMLVLVAVACQGTPQQPANPITPAATTAAPTPTSPSTTPEPGDPSGRQPTAPLIQDGLQPLRCEVDLGGTVLAFDTCVGGAMRLSTSPGADGRVSGIKQEIETMEWMEGTARAASVALTIEGVVHRDVAVRTIGYRDLDDDGDGIPTARASGDLDSDGHADLAAAVPGRMRIGNITLRAGEQGSRGLYQWWMEASEGKDVRRDLSVNVDNGGTRFNALECFPVAFQPWIVDGEETAPVSELVLSCPTLQVESSGERRALADWLNKSDPRNVTLWEAGSGLATGRRKYNLIDAFPTNWSVDFSADPASTTIRWTLEVRVDRIEMA